MQLINSLSKLLLLCFLGIFVNSSELFAKAKDTGKPHGDAPVDRDGEPGINSGDI